MEDRNVDVASCDPTFLGQNSETEQGPEHSGAGDNSSANWQCVSGTLDIMGLLLLVHMTQLLGDRSQKCGESGSVSGIPEITGTLLLLHMSQIFLEQVPAFGETGSVAPDIMRMLLLLHVTQLFSDRSLCLGAW